MTCSMICGGKKRFSSANSSSRERSRSVASMRISACTACCTMVCSTSSSSRSQTSPRSREPTASPPITWPSRWIGSKQVGAQAVEAGVALALDVRVLRLDGDLLAEDLLARRDHELHERLARERRRVLDPAGRHRAGARSAPRRPRTGTPSCRARRRAAPAPGTARRARCRRRSPRPGPRRSRARCPACARAWDRATRSAPTRSAATRRAAAAACPPSGTATRSTSATASTVSAPTAAPYTTARRAAMRAFISSWRSVVRASASSRIESVQYATRMSSTWMPRIACTKRTPTGSDMPNSAPASRMRARCATSGSRARIASTPQRPTKNSITASSRLVSMMPR